MDHTAPASLHLTARTLSPILSHLARSPPPTSSHVSRPPLSLDLAASTLDLLAQVQSEDERMDKEERTPAGEGESKRARFFAWGGLFRTTYCHALLLRATSSKSRPRTKSEQRGVERDFVLAIERLFLRPIDATTNGNGNGHVNGHSHRNDQREDSMEPEFFQVHTTPDEWEWLEAQHALYSRLFEGWLDTGKLEKKQLPRSAGFARIGDRLQRFVDEVVNRSEALGRVGSEVPHTTVPNGQNAKEQVMVQTQSRVQEQAQSVVRREYQSDEMRRPGFSSVDKGKQREEPRSTGPMIEEVNQPPPRMQASNTRSGTGRASAAVMTMESDVDRLKRLKRSLNGGKDLPDPVQHPLPARKQSEDELLDPSPGLKQERGSTIESTAHGEGRRRTRFSLQGDGPDLEGSSASRGMGGFDDVQHEQEHRSQHLPPRRTQVYASSASGSVRPSRSSLPARYMDRERQRERSVSILMPDLPPGTILRVNERGQAEVLKVDHPLAQERDDGYGGVYQDRDHHDGGSRMDEDEMDWRGASFLDEDMDIDPDIDPNLDMEVDDGISVGSHRPSLGAVPAPGPAGYRWALVPDGPEYIVPQPRERRISHVPSASASRSRQAHPNYLRQSQAPTMHHHAGSISNQGRLSLPNLDHGDSRYRRSEGRSSVQPSSAVGRTRYLSPLPDGSRAGSVLGRDPRRRHTDFIRPVARSPLALSSSQAGARQGVNRRRQGHSLGGGESRLMGGRRESVLQEEAEPEPVIHTEDLFNNSLESDDSPFHQPVPPVASVPLPRAQPATRTEPERRASRPVEQARAAPVATTSSRPAPPTVAANHVRSSPRGPTSQVTSTNEQTNHTGSSPLIQRFRPFDNHKVLRNPQNARRARTSTGLHTGRPEFQLAGANERTPERQSEPITQREEEEEHEAPAPAISAKSARQREREEILAQRERSRRRASRIFRTSDDDEDD